MIAHFDNLEKYKKQPILPYMEMTIISWLISRA